MHTKQQPNQPVIYLDHAAATPVDDMVFAQMQPFFTDHFYNPSALYAQARQVKEVLEQARHTVAQLLGARSSEITFTAGGTESANLAISGVTDAFPEAQILISAVEHEAVRKPAEATGRCQEIAVDAHGVVDINDLRKKITEKTVLVSVMYANNEVGTVQPIDEIVAHVTKVRKERANAGNKLPLYVHSDAAQAPLQLDCNVARLGIDLMTLNGGKMHGPKQSGILYHRTGVLLKPQILGGGQELGFRSGTENVAGCIGFAAALKLAIAGRDGYRKEVGALSAYFMNELEKRFNAKLNGHPKQRLANNVHVSFGGVDNERVLFSLDLQGICAASGSACSASSDEPSHVLLAMGVPIDEVRSSLRFTLGKHTTPEEIDHTLIALASALKA